MDNLPPIYSYEDFTKLREEMAKLKPGRLLFILDNLQPAQLRVLDANKAFVVVSGRENKGAQSFYCIARADDLELALAMASRVIEVIGGTNINVSKVN